MMIQESLQKIEQVETRLNPFPGLRPFELHESYLFFGRDGQSEQLIAKLARNRFLAVVGTSGSGKSSLVRAGLLPSLLSGFMNSAGSNWRMAIMRPGNDPIGNLARALNDPEVFGSEHSENRAIQVAITEATLRRGTMGLVDVVTQNVMPATENLLVLADQFEEIFRFAQTAKDPRYENDAAAFVKLLLEASRQTAVKIYVVLTMRSDYLGDCAQFQDLPEAINEAQYLIPRLTRDQRREVIEGPIAVAGAEIAPRLVNRLLNDVGDNPDQLPILQHALMRTWDEWENKRAEHKAVHQGKAIDICCYEAIGGMAEALSRHADEAFHELPDDRSRLICEKLFKCLTEKGADNREIRRPVTLGEACAIVAASEKEVIAVVEPFRKHGRTFLMPPAEAPLNSESLIDISHESLIRVWTRLQQWVNEEAESATTYLRLAETAELHKQGKSELWRGADLQVSLDWQKKTHPTKAWAQRYAPGFETSVAFLLASEQKRANEAAEIEQQRLKEIERTNRTRSLRRGLLISSLLMAAFAGLAIFAWTESGRAQKASETAEMERGRAEAERTKAEKEAENAKKARDEAQFAQEAARQLAARELAYSLQQLAIGEKLDQLDAKIQAVKTIADNALNFAASSVEINAAGTGYERLFRIEFYPEKSSLLNQADKIARISYILAHPSFIKNLLTGKPENGFKAGYTGWGCANEVIAVAEYANSSKAPSITIFPLCEKLGW